LSGRVRTITRIPAASCLYDNKSIPTPAPIPTILGNIDTPNKKGIQIILRVIRIVSNSFFVRNALNEFKECEKVVLCFVSPGSLQLLSQGRWKFDGGPQGLLNVCLDVQSTAFRVFLVNVDRRHLIRCNEVRLGAA
jgi:hypothetical protein